MECPICKEKGITSRMSTRRTIPQTHECPKCFCWIEDNETTNDKIGLLKMQIAALQEKEKQDSKEPVPEAPVHRAKVEAPVESDENNKLKEQIENLRKENAKLKIKKPNDEAVSDYNL